MPREQRSPEAQQYHKWYKLAVWQRIRSAQLNAYPLCERHLKDGDLVPATVVNHKDPHKGDWLKFTGGPFESVCTACHNSEVQAEEKRGYQSGVDSEGFPLDQSHPWYKKRTG